MPNHVHLILAPATPEGLGRALGKAHRRYSAFVNARNRVTGHLFQARFSSVVMDEDHLMAAARYVAHKSGQGAARRARGGLAVVERAGASGRAGRPAGRGRRAPVAQRGPLRRSDRRRAGPGAHRRLARRRDDRPPSRGPAVSRPARRARRARSATAKARPQAAPCGRGRGLTPARQRNRTQETGIQETGNCACVPDIRPVSAIAGARPIRRPPAANGDYRRGSKKVNDRRGSIAASVLARNSHGSYGDTLLIADERGSGHSLEASAASWPRLTHGCPVQVELKQSWSWFESGGGGGGGLRSRVASLRCMRLARTSRTSSRKPGPSFVICCRARMRNRR